MFDNTEFVILSRGRADRVFTLNNLPDEVKSKCYLLVPIDEVDEYKELGLPVVGRPDWITGVHQARQYALDSCIDDNLVMLDDGLCFYKITIDEGKKTMRNATLDQTNDMFLEILSHLSEVPMTGVSLRQTNGRDAATDYDFAYRQMNVHCIKVKYFTENNIRFDKLPLMEDFHVILQLLFKGSCNRVTYKYAQGKHSKAKSNSPGGCSSYRNAELQSECAQRLADMYPEAVNVVNKETKISFEGMRTRKDVRIQWKKAYKIGSTL